MRLVRGESSTICCGAACGVRAAGASPLGSTRRLEEERSASWRTLFLSALADADRIHRQLAPTESTMLGTLRAVRRANARCGLPALRGGRLMRRSLCSGAQRIELQALTPQNIACAAVVQAVPVGGHHEPPHREGGEGTFSMLLVGCPCRGRRTRTRIAEGIEVEARGCSLGREPLCRAGELAWTHVQSLVSRWARDLRFSTPTS